MLKSMLIEYLLLFVFNLFIYLNYDKIIKFYAVYDVPDKKRKIHKHKTSLLGGFIFFANIVFISIIILFSDNFSYEHLVFFRDLNEYFLFIFFAFGFYLLGFYDDKYDLNANLKFIIITCLIIFIIYFDDRLIIELINFSFNDKIFLLGKFDYLFSVFCFVAFINAFNLYDGINLQSGSYTLFILILLTILTNFNILIILFFFPLFLFLILNSNGRIFLGNSGTYLISFLISYLFIKVFNSYDAMYSDYVLATMLIPGLDMIRLFAIRIKQKTSPFKPDRNHIHHKLLEYYGYKKTITLINFVSVFPLISLFIFKNYYAVLISTFLYFVLIALLDKLIKHSR